MNEDLGLISQPISDLFPQPESIDEWASYALSEEQLHEFQQNGFIHGIQLLNEDQIQGLRKALEEIVIPDHEGINDKATVDKKSFDLISNALQSETKGLMVS